MTVYLILSRSERGGRWEYGGRCSRLSDAEDIFRVSGGATYLAVSRVELPSNNDERAALMALGFRNDLTIDEPPGDVLMRNDGSAS